MSAMANTTPIVTTVTKPTTKEKTPKEADATPRVNIQDFCEEHYEDILSVIMDKIRHDKRKKSMLGWTSKKVPRKNNKRGNQKLKCQDLVRKVIEGRARSTDSVILTRRAQLNSDRTDQTLRIFPTVKAALAGGTLLTEIVIGAKTAPVASKSHMIIPAPPMGQGPNMDTTAMETTHVIKKGRESESSSSRVSESGTRDGGH
ncbi:hypothetical protein Tco_0352595 [Tanacetum coccineum]